MKHLPLACLLFLAPAAASVMAAPAAAAAPSDKLSGKVVETMNAATYTYVLVDTGATKAWAAAPQFEVKAGDSVVLSEAMPMTNYHSKTLNRTFDVVYFSGNVRVNGKAPAAAPASPTSAPAPAAELPPGHPSTAKAPAAAPDLTNIKRAPNGQTVAEVYAGKAALVGKPIVVRGRVVKFNANIMGKNWLHLRDGSGTEGTNDLTVTSDMKARVGDLVVITGKLAADRDFGAGYKYGLIVENAKIEVE